MKVTVLDNRALNRVKAIHGLSQRYNRHLGSNHTPKLFKLIKAHAKEIQQLYRVKNKHYLIETGDLIILCFEVLLENGTSVDKTLLKCFKRYEKKLPQLIKEIKNND